MNHDNGLPGSKPRYAEDEDARRLQWDVQEAVDIADGMVFTCETCGNDTSSPEVVCEECLQDEEYDN